MSDNLNDSEATVKSVLETALDLMENHDIVVAPWTYNPASGFAEICDDGYVWSQRVPKDVRQPASSMMNAMRLGATAEEIALYKLEKDRFDEAQARVPWVRGAYVGKVANTRPAPHLRELRKKDAVEEGRANDN